MPDRDEKGKLSEIIKVACQALIREADTQSRHLRLQHDTDTAEYRRQRDLRLAEDRFQKNVHVPLHKLPLEVFSNILVLRHIERVEGFHGPSVMAWLRSVASVARYWRHVVLSTPQLWSFVSDTMSTA
jgi:hypothetical protein